MEQITENWSHIESLSPEVMLEIFSYLSIKDLKTISMTSYRLYDVVSTENLWKNAVIKKRKVMKNGMQPILKKKFKTLVSIDLSGIFCIKTDDFTKLMKFIKESSIQNLNLSCVKMENQRFPRQMPCNKALSKVDSSLLAEAVNVLESVNLSGTYLETKQIIEIFRKMLTRTKLTRLIVGGINFYNVPIDLFSDALTKINEVELFETNVSYQSFKNSFTESQIFSLCQKLEEAPVLKKISVFWQSFNKGCTFLRENGFDAVLNCGKQYCDRMVGFHILVKSEKVSCTNKCRCVSSFK